MDQVVLFVRILMSIPINGIKNIYYKIKTGNKKVLFLKKTLIDSCCKFEGLNIIGENNTLYNCSLGLGTFTSRGNELANVKIGRFCSIGSYVRNTRGRHPTSIFVSTHPSFYSKNKVAGFTYSDVQKFEELKYIEKKYLVVVGNDVWIGDNVTILDGIKIGDGAIIGANSLVTKDIEPYSINVGIPAKLLKYRFNKEIIEKLIVFKWWNQDLSWIKENASTFSDVNEFVNRL